MGNLSEYLNLLITLIKLEKGIEEAIRKEEDARKRKKIQKAFKNRNLNALRDIWFNKS